MTSLPALRLWIARERCLGLHLPHRSEEDADTPGEGEAACRSEEEDWAWDTGFVCGRADCAKGGDIQRGLQLTDAIEKVTERSAVGCRARWSTRV